MKTLKTPRKALTKDGPAPAFTGHRRESEESFMQNRRIKQLSFTLGTFVLGLVLTTTSCAPDVRYVDNGPGTIPGGSITNPTTGGGQAAAPANFNATYTDSFNMLGSATYTFPNANAGVSYINQVDSGIWLRINGGQATNGTTYPRPGVIPKPINYAAQYGCFRVNVSIHAVKQANATAPLVEQAAAGGTKSSGLMWIDQGGPLCPTATTDRYIKLADRLSISGDVVGYRIRLSAATTDYKYRQCTLSPYNWLGGLLNSPSVYWAYLSASQTGNFSSLCSTYYGMAGSLPNHAVSGDIEISVNNGG